MKDELRRHFKAIRKLNFDEYSKREDEIVSTFLSAFANKKSFFVYNSFGTECPTGKLIEILLILGKDVYLPRVEGDKMLAVRSDASTKMQVSSYGIKEPLGTAYNGDFDVIVCPLLAINSKGYRLGYGGGYYDKFCKNKNALKVGYGFSFQLTNEFEEDEWDVPVNFFTCEKGIKKF